MTVPVVWFTSNPEVAPRSYWDQGMLEHLFDRRLWRPAQPLAFEHHEGEPPDGIDGCVLVVPARMENGHATAVQQVIDRLRWVLLILTSDEEASFPWRDLHHQRMAVWVMSARPDRHQGIDRALGSYWPPDCPRLLAGMDVSRDQVWAFLGQVTHDRREDCLRALAHVPGPGLLVTTDTFGAGAPYEDYLAGLAAARLAPCPSGPVSQDSFRLYEALEAGCLPIVDELTPDRRDGYWEFVHPDLPAPRVEDWSTLPAIMAAALARWPANANRASAWWQRHKRDLAYALDDTVRSLAEFACPRPVGVEDAVTVLVPTSPIPSHPGTAVIEETVESIRGSGLGCEIVVMADGVRVEQEHRRDVYEEYLHSLLRLTEHTWSGVLPVIFDHHAHQANMTRVALTEVVRTPLVLFVEHDTPIVGDVPWADLARLVLSGEVNSIRLHHEAEIPWEHEHLMVGGPTLVEGVPVRRTIQWSQRPHLASADFYRGVLGEHFAPECRTMIEDVMHGVVQDAPWTRHRLAIYHPRWPIKRSGHLDGRGDDPKFPMLMVAP